MSPQAWRKRSKAAVFASLVVLGSLSLLAFGFADANVGCPGSTSNLGDITLSGTCTVDADTTWENGSITIAGDIVLNGGVALTLRSVDILFDPSFDQEFRMIVYGAFVMEGGGIESTNANRWGFATGSGSTVTLDGTDFANGKYDFSSSVADIGYSTFRDTDSTDGQHLWLGAYSDFHHNLVTGVSLTADAAVVVWKNWGETRVWGNELHLECYGNNCMGIEVIDMHDALTSLYPGFPVVEVAWNNVTWEVIASGTDSASFDHEYSMRLYVHNNTQHVNPSGLAAGEAVTEPLEMGGPLSSVFENNTFFGPSKFGIYHYIYSNAQNLVQYNQFYDVQWGGIFQTGVNTYRHNDFINVSDSGIWICPNAPCAGFDAGTADNRWYGNSFTYLPGATLVRADTGNMFDNTLIHHGNGQVNQWEDGSLHTVYGDGAWLYWADQDIDALQFVNTTGGTRYVNMTVGGTVYPSSFPGFSTTDDASLTVSGAIDRTGSSNYDDSQSFTVLWSLSPQLTEVDVLATGALTFAVDAFAANWDYSVDVWDYGSSQGSTQSFTTDAQGQGSFNIGSAGHYKVTIDADGTPPPPPPPPPDTSPPAQVTDLDAVALDSQNVTLEWGAPGDDGSAGQASAYDVRYSTAGPVNDTNFAAATPVPATPPDPAPSGTLESLLVPGLTPETTYWFALRTADEVPNWSPVSNTAAATTPEGPPEATPPAQVTDLAVATVTSEAVALEWTAPGDDGSAGQATTYDVRYSTEGPLNETTFGGGTAVLAPSPGPAGTVETLNVTGLDASTTYWFALRAADEVPNWSPVSNPIQATTLEEAPTDVAPVVAFTSPEDEEVVSGNVLVTVSALDDTGIAEVVLFVEGAQWGSRSAAPYTWTWPTGDLSPGAYDLEAKATDPAGHEGSDEITVFVTSESDFPQPLSIPKVQSVWFSPANTSLEMVFSAPMDATSVEGAISVSPEAPFAASWANASHLTLRFEAPLDPEATYLLVVEPTARDIEGQTLASRFEFRFHPVAPTEPPRSAQGLWWGLVAFLSVSLAAAIVSLLRSYRRVAALEATAERTESRLRELNQSHRPRPTIVESSRYWK